jgi:hypothetical protein
MYHPNGMVRPSHRIKNLQAFLDRLDLPSDGPSPVALAYTLFLAAPLALILVTNLEDGGRFLWVIAALLLGVIGLIAGIEMKSRKRFANRKQRFPEAHELCAELNALHRDGTLEERLDPAVGDELDACAAAYVEIGQVLEQPEWRNAEGNRASARISVLNACDALMGDAMLIAASGIRAKGMRRDAFAKRMQNPQIKEPLMSSLGRVRRGLETLRSELGNHPASTPDSLYELESALSKLTEIRQAEEELHQSIRQ